MQDAEVVLGVLRDHWRATCIERCPRGSVGSSAEKGLLDRYLAMRLIRFLTSMPAYPGAFQNVNIRRTRARAILPGQSDPLLRFHSGEARMRR